jgi:hypothetical protein
MLSRTPLFFLLGLIILMQSPIAAQYRTDFPEGLSVDRHQDMKFADFPVLTPDFISFKSTLPANVDNSELPFMRPVFRQQGASCGQSAIIGYNFTYEMNRLRGVASDTSVHLYPDHFVWNFMNASSPYYGEGVSYFHTFDLLYDAGTPNEMLYGPIEFDDSYYWSSGYEVYHNAMTNRISGAASIRPGTPEGMEVLKHWLHNHLEGAESGGVASFYAGLAYSLVQLPEESAETGKHAFYRFGPDATHAMTIVGYNDSVCYDINDDGQFTNHLDITGDGIVDMRDWEYGALKAVNSYGPDWGDDGYFYLMYRTLAMDYGAGGGIWNNSVHVMFPDQQWHPKLTIKASLKHSSREKIRLRAGVSLDTTRFIPEHTISFTHFNFQGGDYPMRGRGINANEPLELGLDISELLSYVPAGQAARFFLIIDEKDPDSSGLGVLQYMSLREYDSDNLLHEIVADFVPKAIRNNGTTTASVVLVPQAVPPNFEPEQSIVINPANDTIIQLQEVAGQAPFSFHILPEYSETAQIAAYPEVQSNLLPIADEESGYAEIPLPFSFPFAGQSYDTLYMHVDGYLMFEPEDMPYYYLLYDELYLQQLKIIAGFMHHDLGLFHTGNRLGWQSNPDSVFLEWKVSDEAGMASVTFSTTLFPDGSISFHYKDIPEDPTFNPVIGLGFATLENAHFSNPFFSAYSGSMPLQNLRILLKPGADIQRMYINQNQQFVWQGGGFNQGKALLRMIASNRLYSDRIIRVNDGLTFNLTLPDNVNLVSTQNITALDLIIENTQDRTIEISEIQFQEAAVGYDVQTNLDLPISLAAGETKLLPSVCLITPENEALKKVLINILAETSDQEYFSQSIFETSFIDPVLFPPLVMDENNQQLEPGERARLVYEVVNEGTADLDQLQLSIQLRDPFIMLLSDSMLTIEKLAAQKLVRVVFEIQTTQAAPQGRTFEVVAKLRQNEQLLISGRDRLQIGESKVALIDMDRNHNSAPILERELANNAIDYSRYEAIDSAIYNYEIAFLTLGVMPNYYTITSAEDQLLSDYLRGGGNLYLVGGSFFFMSPPTQLRELLRTEGYMDGVQYPADTLAGLAGNPVNGMKFTYQGDQALCENLLPQAPAQAWFADPQTDLNFVAAIDSVRYKGIVTSMEFGGLRAVEESSLTELMSIYLDFLGYANAEVSSKFSASSRSTCPEEGVSFQFSGLGSPDIIRWYFEGGTADDYNSLNPLVNYAFPGLYDVGLYVESNGKTDSLFIEDYLLVNSCAAVSENINNGVFLYPNPANNQLHILLGNPVEENTTLLVYDMEGQLLRQNEIPLGSREYGMNIASLLPGVYLLKVFSGQQQYTVKFIKYK